MLPPFVYFVYFVVQQISGSDKAAKRSMQFTLRQFLLFFVCLQAWFGALASGHYLFGTYGMEIFGSMYGIALILLFRLLLRFRERSMKDRCMFLVAIMVAVSAAIYLTNFAYSHGYYITQERSRRAVRLQAELAQDARFDHVVLLYESPNERWGWLSIDGVVASPEALDELHRRIDNDEEWNAHWQVHVSPQR